MHKPPVNALKTAIRTLSGHRGHREACMQLEKLLARAEQGNVIIAGDDLQTTLQRAVTAHGHDTMHVILGRERADGTYTITCTTDTTEEP